MSASPLRRRDGFTFTELLVVVALGAVILVALQQLLFRQLRFHESQRAVSERNESVRYAMAVLGTTLREASVSGGDVEVLAPDRLRARVPHGHAVVCGAANPGGQVGIVDPRGRWAVGDSVILTRDSGRHVDRIARIDPAGPQVPCSLTGPGSVVRLDQPVPDVVPGSGIRAFRSHVFEGTTGGGAGWLYRTDGARTDLLVGPLDAADGFSVWYEDGTGAQVADRADAERVAVRVVARGPDVRGVTPLLRDTLLLRFGGRN